MVWNVKSTYLLPDPLRAKANLKKHELSIRPHLFPQNTPHRPFLTKPSWKTNSQQYYKELKILHKRNLTDKSVNQPVIKSAKVLIEDFMSVLPISLESLFTINSFAIFCTTIYVHHKMLLHILYWYGTNQNFVSAFTKFLMPAADRDFSFFSSYLKKFLKSQHLLTTRRTLKGQYRVIWFCRSFYPLWYAILDLTFCRDMNEFVYLRAIHISVRQIRPYLVN